MPHVYKMGVVTRGNNLDVYSNRAEGGMTQRQGVLGVGQDGIGTRG